MVLGVCRRILGNHADAEDAFQATFLVLVRKAASIRRQGMVGNWLYGVAHHTALKAKTMQSRRRAKEHEAGALPRANANDEAQPPGPARGGRTSPAWPTSTACRSCCATWKDGPSRKCWPAAWLAARHRGVAADARGRAILARA